MSCLLCNRNLDDYETCNVGCRGLKALIQASIDRKDNIIEKTFRSVETITLHSICRSRYARRQSDGKICKFTGPYCDPEVKFKYVPILTANPSNVNVTKPPRRNVDITVTTSTDTNFETQSVENEFNLRAKSDSTPETAIYLPESILESDNSTGIKYSLSRKERSSVAESQTLTEEDDPTKPFPFQHKCLFCGKDATVNLRICVDKRIKVSTVSKEHTQEKIMRELKQFLCPENMKILQRIKDVDLMREKARYHYDCYMKISMSMPGKKGRPVCPLIISAVEKICKYIDECDRTEFTSAELTSASLHGDYQPSWRSVEKKLLAKYEGKIYFTSLPGRSTIVTVLQDSEAVGSMVTQPWNLNSTELGGQIEDVQKKKDKHVKQKKSNRAKQKKNEIMDADTKINVNKCDEEQMRVDSDDDYMDDLSYSEDNADNKSNLLICQICMSSDRKLKDLGDYIDVLRKLCSDIFVENFEPKMFLLCWECIALLKNVKHFQNKVMIAQKLWNTEVQVAPRSLSTLHITKPATASFSYTDEKQAAAQDEKSLDIIEHVVVPVEFVPQDLNIPPQEDQRVTMEENNMDYDSFDYDTKDVNIDDDSDDKKRRKPTIKKRKAKEKRKKCSDLDEDLEKPRKTIRPTGGKPEESEEDPDWKEVTETKKHENGKKKSVKEDPDWKEVAETKKHVNGKKKNIKLKIPYTMIVQTYITETKMKRELIAPHDVYYWLDNERKSDYFQNSNNKKCMKCISEVDDNHDELCHSEEYPYVCKICECTFTRKEEQESHEANHYYIFSCEFCPYKCYNQTHMRCHVESHRRLVQCLECFAAFQSFDILKEHFYDLHRYAECDHCGKQFAHKRTVKTHIDRCHTPQICTICNTRYSSYSHKMNHMNLKHRVQRTEAAYCVQCDIQFDNEALLKRHVYHSSRHKHEWKREPPKKVKEQHTCPECPNVYASKHTMRCHYNLVHAKKITFYCKYCDKPFPSKNNYKNHMKTRHEGYERPKNKFCHICGRGFADNRILTNHIRTHTGERPFACPHCASSFAQKAALRSHIAHVHEKRRRTSAAEPCTKRRRSVAEPTGFFDSSLSLM